MNDLTAVADAGLSCHDLAQRQNAPQVEASLERHSLTEFQSDLVEIYRQYFCPQYEQRATDNLSSSILGG